MASYKAIQAVSDSLRTLLVDRMGSEVDVTIAPPDVVVDGIARNRLNLYLYQVTENAYLKNQEIPGQSSPGAYGQPPLSLDLHYLLTTHAATETAIDADRTAQEVLGDAMRVLHDYAILGSDLLITRDGSQKGEHILDVNLRNEFERVKISLEPLSLSDLSNLWAALPKGAFRRSVAYQVSVVQIESTQPRSAGRPVQERRVYALPLRTPHISEVTRTPLLPGAPPAAAQAGDTLRIRGTNFGGRETWVRLGTVEIQIGLPARDDEMDVPVPATLPAGVHAVQVIHKLKLKGATAASLPVDHDLESNLAAFVLIPTIVSVDPPATAQAGNIVTVRTSPPPGQAQKALVLLDDVALPAQWVAGHPDATPPLPSSLRFTVPGEDVLRHQRYLLRVRIDGAESPLDFDPATHAYVGPYYEII